MMTTEAKIMYSVMFMESKPLSEPKILYMIVSMIPMQIMVENPMFVFFLVLIISSKKKGSESPHLGHICALALIFSLQFLQ